MSDLLDDPGINEWDARANAARCQQITGELHDLGRRLSGWKPELPDWKDWRAA